MSYGILWNCSEISSILLENNNMSARHSEVELEPEMLIVNGRSSAIRAIFC